MCTDDARDFFIRIGTEYPITIKVIQLVLVCVSFSLMSQYYSYEIPSWLWIVYCIDSATYLIIIIVTIISYIFQDNCYVLDLYFTAIGVPIYLIGAIGGVIQEIVLDPSDASNGPSQLYLSALFSAIALYMIGHVSLIIYAERNEW